MKTSASILTIAAAALLTSCTDEQARQYALKLNDILKQYEEQTRATIETEAAFYKKEAGVFQTESERDVYESLGLTRQELASRRAGDLIEGRLSAGQVLDQMHQYGSQDFDRTRTLFESEMNASGRYLAALQNLELEADKAAALAQVLSQLSKPPGLGEEFQSLAAFGKQAKDSFDLEACQDLERRFSNADAMQKDAKQRADAEKDAKKKAVLNAALGKAQARATALKSSLENNSRYSKAESKCK